MTARLLALVLLVAAPAMAAPSLEEDVRLVLSHRGLGDNALGIIANVLDNEPMLAPRAVPPLVRELLARPLAAVETTRLFERSVPAALAALAEEALAPAEPFDRLLDRYVDELAQAQALLRSATEGVDDQLLLRELTSRGLSDHALSDAERALQRAGLDKAGRVFLEATRRFVAGLRAAGGALPPQGRRDSRIGSIIIGSTGADRHGADAALIIDPGGDDVYERQPAHSAAISVVIDLGGNDVYTGSDVAVRALSAIVDLEGNDSYRMTRSGLGAAVAGISIVVDYRGDDVYEAATFGEGAAALGIGALIDLRGNDTYRLEARGQGYGLAGGLGLLWDRGGDDHYGGDGTPDFWKREGRVGFTQGVASGYRNSLAAGVGILRDDAGNDVYEAQMFAQGTGYFFGLGILWDRAGNDVYRAVRYAQGNGVHQAVGVLRDEGGNDRYELIASFGQGMGLDLAVGILLDEAGDDAYEASYLAQATATANGFGLLADRAGNNTLSLREKSGWGWVADLRRLPSVGVLLADAAHAGFLARGEPLTVSAAQLTSGGPYAAPWRPPAPTEPPACPSIAPAASGPDLPFAEALLPLAPELQGGNPPAPQYAAVLRAVLDDPGATMAQIPPRDFDLLVSFDAVLFCAARAASASEAERLWRVFERTLAADPGSPFAAGIGAALRARPPEPARLSRLRSALAEHPSCAVRALAMVAWASAAEARTALGSSCWRLRAAAYERLHSLGAARVEDASRLPFAAR